MIGKIKLTQEQVKAIESFLTDNDGDTDHFIDWYAVNSKYKDSWNKEYKGFSGLSHSDLARALLIGYEVEPVYAKGDWVAHLDGSNIYANGNTKIVEVHSYEQYHEGVDYVRHGENGEWGTPVNLLRHATPEEIKAEKERRKWAKIGREVGEFRHGDVRITKGIVSGFVRTHCAKNAKDEYEDGELRGFYPIESFISFEDGDSHA